MAQVILAFPVGYFGDRFLAAHSMGSSCRPMCNVNHCLYLSSLPGAPLTLFYVGFFVWGGYVVLTNPAIESLFADSSTRTSHFHLSLKFAYYRLRAPPASNFSRFILSFW